MKNQMKKGELERRLCERNGTISEPVEIKVCNNNNKVMFGSW